MEKIEIRTISYSPGYGDMLGEYHEISLIKSGDGKWTYVGRSREDHMSPTTVSTYAVTEEDAMRFFEFIINKKVISLNERPESDIFATDYSPWNWSIVYDAKSFGKQKRYYCSFGEYREYSKADHELLGELEKRLYALRGEKISETVED